MLTIDSIALEELDRRGISPITAGQPLMVPFDVVRDVAERYAKEAAKINLEIKSEIAKAVHLLGGQSDILCIIGSYKDTLPDADILQMLKEWNTDKEKELCPQ